MNKAEVWNGIGTGHKFLVEPLINTSFVKFNSNSGYQLNSDDVSKALSHFSYHTSNRKLLLCDLQGGIIRNVDEEGGDIDVYILTDPIILSTKAGQYGITDFG